jgi:hypothetical protein
MFYKRPGFLTSLSYDSAPPQSPTPPVSFSFFLCVAETLTTAFYSLTTGTVHGSPILAPDNKRGGGGEHGPQKRERKRKLRFQEPYVGTLCKDF